MLSGYKTYIIGAIMVLYGLSLVWQGQSDVGSKMILEGLGLIFLRIGQKAASDSATSQFNVVSRKLTILKDNECK